MLPAEAPVLTVGPVASQRIQTTGPDSNRMVVVIMGDGYTGDDLDSGLMATHTANLWNAFGSKAPWGDYMRAINVYRVDVESTQQGADDPGAVPPVYVDTYFNSTFWNGGVERNLAVDSTGRSHAIAAANAMVGAGIWDQILITVNSTK